MSDDRDEIGKAIDKYTSEVGGSAGFEEIQKLRDEIAGVIEANEYLYVDVYSRSIIGKLIRGVLK